MPLHLLKLCVGADSIRDMEQWVAEKLAMKRAAHMTISFKMGLLPLPEPGKKA